MSMRWVTYILLILILYPKVNLGQNAADSIPAKCLNKEYIKSYFSDVKPLIISPSKWERNDWIIAGTVAGSTALAFVFDEEIGRFSQRNRTHFLDQSNVYFFDPFGKMYYTVPFMGALYVYGLASKKSKPKVVALDFVKASFYSGVIITGIKHLSHRHRPFQTNPTNSMLWDGPITDNWHHTSFASGHTIMAFTFASVLATHYSDRLWIPVLAYSVAGLSGLARIYDNKHWTSDVIVGAALGYAVGKWVVKNNRYCRFSLDASYGNNFTGLSLKYKLL